MVQKNLRHVIPVPGSVQRGRPDVGPGLGHAAQKRGPGPSASTLGTSGNASGAPQQDHQTSPEKARFFSPGSHTKRASRASRNLSGRLVHGHVPGGGIPSDGHLKILNDEKWWKSTMRFPEWMVEHGTTGASQHSHQHEGI